VKSFIICVLTLFVSTAFSSQRRVPYVFTGNSTSPSHSHYDSYKYKKDDRDSREFTEYYLISNSELNRFISREGLNSIHFHVRNIAVDGLCDYSQCFRVYVFANGDEDDGKHLATFVVSPGTGRRTPLVSDVPLRRWTRWLRSYESPTQFEDFDMYRVYGSKSYPGPIANMPNAMFYMDAIAIHGSFDTVDGSKRSHGCVRMFPDESYWVQTLARAAGGNVTFDVLHTR
jgi:hypothetical protein